MNINRTELQTKLLSLKADLSSDVELIAVSKTKPNEAILEAYEVGQRQFGENKVQELCSKYETLPKDIEWHMIGHLQRNKVKYIVPFVSRIHALDSARLAKEVDKRAKANNRKINCLVQVHLAKEETKHGFSFDEAEVFLEQLEDYPNLEIDGLMAMASLTKNKEEIEAEFKEMQSFFEAQQNKNPKIRVLSMGMSGDYQLALACGSTMLRLGSTLFGKRS